MKALVTGGGGFLGGAIVRQLLAEGVQVVSVARGDYPPLAALGVEVLRGDLADPAAVARAVEGCDVVFHVAARAGIWGSFAAFHAANVVGTQNVIAACRERGVRDLVYTSSPSVVHGGGSLEGVDESTPYPEHFEAHYPRTKAEAEQRVMAANDATLRTVSLRPHLIWGPGDVHFVPRIVHRHRSGRLRLVGDGTNLIDTVYIDNAARAHLDAWRALRSGGPTGAACAGRTYFITNGEPLPARDFISRIAAAAGLPPVTKTIAPGLAYGIGAVLEGVYGLFRIEQEPPMTRFLASQLATAHWYNIDAARRDLGYVPTVSIDEGMGRLRASLMAGEGGNVIGNG